MKLDSTTIKNFRAFAEETSLSFTNLTAIIGRNDVGKSSILDALEIFYNNETVKLEPADINIYADDQFVEISCEFSDLPETLVLDVQAQTSLAQEYLLNLSQKLRIKKRLRCAGGKTKEEVFVCCLHPSANNYSDLLQLTQPQLRTRMRSLGVDESNIDLSSNPALRSAIWASCPDLQLVETEVPVTKEDGKRIWDKLSQYLPVFALFQSDRPSRDSDSEVQDPMKLAIATALSDPSIAEKLADVANAVRTQAMDLANRTHRTLSDLDPDLARELTPEFKADPKWAGLFTLTLKSDEGIPVNKRGSGVRRMILVSFFRAEAERRRTEEGEHNIIYAIEEPETSQHPNNQRLLLESFHDLASEDNCQVIISTHSPGFANYLPLDSFRFVKRESDNSRSITECCDSVYQDIVNTLGVVPDNRVRVLFCVEGPTDVKDMRCLSRALHLDDSTILDLSCDPRIAFIVLGGGTLMHWVNEHYLGGLGRPEVHIYDSDVAKYGQAIAAINNRIDGSWGVLTQKYEIENYLHPDAILEGLGININFGDTDDLPALFRNISGWNPKTAKLKLADFAFPRMTAARIRERDPQGEVEGWLRRIASML